MENITESTHADAAKMIRQALKNEFPGVKFGVKSSSYSGGNSVDIGYEDGPTTAKVEDVVKRFQMGHFDGMQDYYDYSNRDDSIPQVKFVMVARKPSAQTKEQIKMELAKKWGISDPDDKTEWSEKMGEFGADRLVYKEFYQMYLYKRPVKVERGRAPKSTRQNEEEIKKGYKIIKFDDLMKKGRRSLNEMFMHQLEEAKDKKGAEKAFKDLVKSDSKYKSLLAAYKKEQDQILELVEYTFKKYEKQIEKIVKDFSIDEGAMTDIIAGN